MIDLDPQKIDQEGRRKRRRKMMLRAVALPCVLLVAMAFLFLQPLLFNVFFSANYNNQNYGGALVDTNIQLGVNLVEPYLGYYNRGVVELASGNNAAAEGDFRRSLKERPPESQLCRIRVNLALSLERQGDAAADTQSFQEAIVDYNYAESALRDDDCLANEGAKKGDEKAVLALARIDEKRKTVVARMNSNGDATEPSDEAATVALGQDELEAIRERQKNAATLRARARSLEAAKLAGDDRMDNSASGF